MKTTFALGLLLAAVGLSCGSEPRDSPKNDRAESPSVAASKEGEWMATHEAFLERARQGSIDLLFLGDSITAWWPKGHGGENGSPEAWDRYYARRNAANFGVPGDRVQHLLWRIENGEIDGLRPKVVVVLIGTNNVMIDTPAEVADGIATVVKRLRTKLPASKILLLGIFPRSRHNDMTRERNNAVNERIKKLDDGAFVVYRDLGPHFIDPDGAISPDIMPDALHLSRKGYEIWAEAMEPTLRTMLGEESEANDTPSIPVR